MWAVWVYRFGLRTLKLKPGFIKDIRLWFYWGMFHGNPPPPGISIDCHAVIGPGLRIFHFGNVFIHGGAVLGANCTLRQGVTIGIIGDDGPAPTIGNDVEFGAYAQVVGGVRNGDGAKIGAMSLVISDVLGPPFGRWRSGSSRFPSGKGGGVGDPQRRSLPASVTGNSATMRTLDRRPYAARASVAPPPGSPVPGSGA